MPIQVVDVAAQGTARCQRHDRYCAVKLCDIQLSGFSCKSLSKQNGVQEDRKSVLLRKDKDATTVQTFYANLALSERCDPDFVFLENLDVILEKGGDAADDGDKNDFEA